MKRLMDEYPDELQPFLDNAVLHDCSCSSEATVVFIGIMDIF